MSDWNSDVCYSDLPVSLRGDFHVGLQARLMSQSLRKLTGSISKSKTLVIFINQLRMKIGVMYGNPETTTGGNALKFYASVRLDIRRTGANKVGEDVVGNATRVKVVKNKVQPPFKPVEFDIMKWEENTSKHQHLLTPSAPTRRSSILVPALTANRKRS